ncbi:patatin-like phospholipase family protein [Sphaerisporangium flaviroseum]|uniref:Patatin-like phospholipase family protein n=1 Tax=Sphaerisporangium flaviroseum TaxID=509199 RepID=A0ABP7HTL8_9ACTN
MDSAKKVPGGRALVLGAGGVAGLGWEMGVVARLAEFGVELAQADLIVGTSAGAVAGAQLAAGLDVRKAYESQLVPVEGEQAPWTDLLGMGRLIWTARAARDDPERFGKWIGQVALAAATVSVAERRDLIARYLGEVRDWPDRPFLITAVDAESGEFVGFDSTGGVDLVDAVAASTAGPGIRLPPVINGRRYIDGGMRSPVNADLAVGHDRVVVLGPLIREGGPVGRLNDEIAELGTGVRVAVLSPDRAARKALGEGMRMPDQGRRAAAARAGWTQAATVADSIAGVWHG